MAILDDVKPWERQENETPRAYEAFCVYRDLGPGRSITKTSQALHKNRTTIGEWSTKNDWVKRATAWDDENDRLARELAQKEQAEAIKKMRKRHAALAMKMLEKAEAAIDSIIDEDIKPTDIPRMVDVAAKLERISLGDVGDVIEERDGGEAIPAVQFYIPSNGRDKKDEEEEE